jgi:P-type Ca2+ transporter type 2C
MALAAPAHGLTSRQAAQVRAETGPNRIPEPPRPGLWRLVLEQLRDPMIIVLLLAALLTTVTGDHPDTIVILVVIVANTTVGVVQQRRAEEAVAALHELAAPTATVVRDGVPQVLEAAEVVPGDRVIVAAGDVVCADGDLAVAEALMVDEAAMTGESVPVAHGAGDVLVAGTLVVRGRGEMDVTATGPDSGLGRLAGLVQDTRQRRTPLQDRMNRLSGLLVAVVLILTLVVVVLGLLRGEGLVEMLVVGASLTVAAVPESLPAVITVALATGARRMARRSAVVRRLSAVETLGSVSVIATDKTGTLTHGSLHVEHLWTPDGAAGAALDALLRDMVLCNDARPGPDGVRPSGDPLEVALLERAREEGVDVVAVRAAWPRHAERPFDAATLSMTTVHVGDAGTHTVLKGAPERVLPLVVGGSRELGEQVAERWAAEGCRVLAVASTGTDDLTPRAGTLDLVGLIGFTDPPREAAGAVVRRCQDAGIRVLLVTGDHALTARSVARQVGIPPDVAASPEEPGEASVFARVTPEQKLDLVGALQGDGEVVAMLGDGVNDAPALRRADIGVAAGQSGTEVARQAADLVLLDDDLSTVVAAVEEGRRIFANLRAFLLYAVSGGLAEVGVMLLGPFLGMPLPLLPSQILWVNLLTHGLTGVAFSTEPSDPASMRDPPLPRSASLLDRRHLVLLAAAAGAVTAASLTAALLADGSSRSAAFVALGLGQLGVALAVRGTHVRWWARSSRNLTLGVLCSALLMLAPLYLEPVGDLLRTASLGGRDVLVAVLVACLPGLLVRLLARRYRSPAHQQAG